jgi:hypothetical protein
VARVSHDLLIGHAIPVRHRDKNTRIPCGVIGSSKVPSIPAAVALEQDLADGVGVFVRTTAQLYGRHCISKSPSSNCS